MEPWEGILNLGLKICCQNRHWSSNSFSSIALGKAMQSKTLSHCKCIYLYAEMHMECEVRRVGWLVGWFYGGSNLLVIAHFYK